MESATYSKMHARVLKQITVVCCVIAALIKMTTQYVRLSFSETSTKRCEEFGDEKDVSPMYIYPMSNEHWIVQHRNEHSPSCKWRMWLLMNGTALLVLWPHSKTAPAPAWRIWLHTVCGLRKPVTTKNLSILLLENCWSSEKHYALHPSPFPYF